MWGWSAGYGGGNSRWIPGGPEDLEGCEAIFDVEESSGTSLPVTGGFDYVGAGTLSCILAP